MIAARASPLPRCPFSRFQGPHLLPIVKTWYSHARQLFACYQLSGMSTATCSCSNTTTRMPARRTQNTVDCSAVTRTMSLGQLTSGLVSNDTLLTRMLTPGVFVHASKTMDDFKYFLRLLSCSGDFINIQTCSDCYLRFTFLRLSVTTMYEAVTYE